MVSVTKCLNCNRIIWNHVLKKNQLTGDKQCIECGSTDLTDNW
jgi:RNA polymerase subunit RPABC4/transcription elongation factor Spt4